jgi:cyclohexanone monooxygenase
MATEKIDVVVVGAGMGGIYALHRFRQQGLNVLGLEGASGVGGVWFHNRYPGARVDLESVDYCFYFSSEIFNEWTWTERNASQPELLRYLNFVTDRLDLRRLIQFETWLTAAQWDAESAEWALTTSSGAQFRTRFLVMATGNLSAARAPAFEGLDNYKGECVRTSHWPDREVQIAGRRVAVIGTGSSAVQAIPVIAEQAKHLTVFQRSPNYSVPACNGPADLERLAEIRARVPEVRKELFATVGASNVMLPSAPMADFDEAEIAARLEKQWNSGGHGMSYLFADQGRNEESNYKVAEFVRNKIRSIVKDPELAETLCPQDHAIGTRRLCVDTGYYATYNRENVTLVNVRDNPIARISETGIVLEDGQSFDVDLIVLALGFHPFTGSWDRIDIRNDKGAGPTDHWDRGPKTLLGLMTAGFPNFFFLTGPGSPSVLANLFLMNEYHVDWVGDLIAHMDAHGLRTVQPTEAAQEAWSAHVAEVAAPTIRLRTRNYMVHRNEDGSGVFIPYIGGFKRYADQADAVAADGYSGFVLS